MLQHPLETNDVFALIEEVSGQRLGVGDAWRWKRFRPTRIRRRRCRCPTARALLMLERLTSLDDGRPVDLEYIRMRGDRITMRGNLIRSET